MKRIFLNWEEVPDIKFFFSPDLPGLLFVNQAACDDTTLRLTCLHLLPGGKEYLLSLCNAQGEEEDPGRQRRKRQTI